MVAALVCLISPFTGEVFGRGSSAKRHFRWEAMLLSCPLRGTRHALLCSTRASDVSGRDIRQGIGEARPH